MWSNSRSIYTGWFWLIVSHMVAGDWGWGHLTAFFIHTPGLWPRKTNNWKLGQLGFLEDLSLLSVLHVVSTVLCQHDSRSAYMVAQDSRMKRGWQRQNSDGLLWPLLTSTIVLVVLHSIHSVIYKGSSGFKGICAKGERHRFHHLARKFWGSVGLEIFLQPFLENTIHSSRALAEYNWDGNFNSWFSCK